MRVLDAGVVVELLVGRLDETALGEEEAGVPHLLDSEVTSVLRRLVLRGDLTVEQGDAAMARSSTWTSSGSRPTGCGPACGSCGRT